MPTMLNHYSSIVMASSIIIIFPHYYFCSCIHLRKLTFLYISYTWVLPVGNKNVIIITIIIKRAANTGSLESRVGHEKLLLEKTVSCRDTQDKVVK